MCCVHIFFLSWTMIFRRRWEGEMRWKKCEQWEMGNKKMVICSSEWNVVNHFDTLTMHFSKTIATNGGDMGQEVRAVVWQSEGCRFDPTLGVSKCPWARHLTPKLLLTSWLVPCMAANCRWCVNMNVCVNGWMRGINCTALWIKALYKCSPFTIYKDQQFTGIKCFLWIQLGLLKCIW